MSNPLAASSLSGKVALVTGSSRGIGADTLGYFAEAGASVIVNFRNKESRALKIVDGIKANGGNL
jgi:NAD(P)-dependent dehydrogenase (short-subunit alcohol dehydrogenase family)